MVNHGIQGGWTINACMCMENKTNVRMPPAKEISLMAMHY